MNILFLYPRMFHPYPGGIEKVSELLWTEFLKRGHHIFRLHVRDKGCWDGALIPPSYFPYPDHDFKKNGRFYKDFLEKNHIDIVINQDPLNNYRLLQFSKELPGVYTISVVHFYPLGIYDHLIELIMWTKGNKTLLGSIRKMARILKAPMVKYNFMQTLKIQYKEILTSTDCLCLLSSKFIPDLKRVCSTNLNRVIAIPNPNTYLASEQLSFPKKKQIIYVGRVEWYQKRVGRLIDIWKLLYKDFPDWELLIVGDGPIKQDLEQKSSKIERISFVGYQEPEPFYRSASILCLTSDYEGWGMVLTEAMTFGTIPVLFNSFAAVTDIIEDGRNGILVPPFSCKKFARKLGALMRDETLRVEMSANCRQSVKRFDIQYVADKWEEVFNSLKKD